MHDMEKKPLLKRLFKNATIGGSISIERLIEICKKIIKYIKLRT